MSLFVFMIDSCKDLITVVEERLDQESTTNSGILSNP